MISKHYQVYSSTTEYQRASLTILPTGNYNLPFMGHKIPYLSSLLVTCHQSSRSYGVITASRGQLSNNKTFYLCHMQTHPIRIPKYYNRPIGYLFLQTPLQFVFCRGLLIAQGALNDKIDSPEKVRRQTNDAAILYCMIKRTNELTKKIRKYI